MELNIKKWYNTEMYQLKKPRVYVVYNIYIVPHITVCRSIRFIYIMEATWGE